MSMQYTYLKNALYLLKQKTSQFPDKIRKKFCISKLFSLFSKIVKSYPFSKMKYFRKAFHLIQTTMLIKAPDYHFSHFTYKMNIVF